MHLAHKHRQHTRRTRRAVEQRIRHLANRHPLLAIALGPVIVVVGLVIVLVRVAATIAVKALIVMWRLTITLTLVVCLNIFRTFPG